ncbi:uncharacterized protein J3D65DRAFT_387606 [Phyllosticta citribraziliensis]|uniref:Secreted protein n=1 Tax=Phyllosticta citribraziliensis TaxID=989973 RepID=A0ABR1LQX0_9PEZI
MLLLVTFVSLYLSHNLFLILVIFLRSVSSSCTLHLPFEALSTACDHPWTYNITPRMIHTNTFHNFWSSGARPTNLGRFPILGRFPGRSPDSALSENVAAKGLRHVVIDRRRAPTPAFPCVPRAPLYNKGLQRCAPSPRPTVPPSFDDPCQRQQFQAPLRRSGE